MAAKRAMQAITHATGMKYDCPTVIMPIKSKKACQFVDFGMQEFYLMFYHIRADSIADFHQCDKPYHHPQHSRLLQIWKQLISYSQDKYEVCQAIQSGSELALHTPSLCHETIEHIRSSCYHVEHPEGHSHCIHHE
jgi:hypothetical protein